MKAGSMVYAGNGIDSPMSMSGAFQMLRSSQAGRWEVDQPGSSKNFEVIMKDGKTYKNTLPK
jgi:hypothetical protein